MLNVRQEPDFVVITASGNLTTEDYEAFVRAFERIAAERGKVSMLVDATRLSGWDYLQAMWKDLKFDATHQNDFGPIAVIGDARWQEWGTNLSRPFFKAGMRFFGPEAVEEAQQWLREESTAQA